MKATMFFREWKMSHLENKIAKLISQVDYLEDLVRQAMLDFEERKGKDLQDNLCQMRMDSRKLEKRLQKKKLKLVLAKMRYARVVGGNPWEALFRHSDGDAKNILRMNP